MAEQKSIIDLLPYSSNCLLSDASLRKRILRLIGYIFDEMLEAIDDFYIKKDFSKFDPHVGDNLCQIRAVQIIELYNELSSKFEVDFKKDILKYKAVILRLYDRDVNIILDKENGHTLFGVLEKLQINVKISQKMYYLFLSHFLTRFRVFNEEENATIDYKMLLQKTSASKHLARKIIHEYQKKLSLESSLYVATLAKKDMAKHINIALLKATFRIDDDGRYVYSCFLVMELLFHKLMAMEIDVFCLIRTDYLDEKQFICLRFTFNKSKQKYQFTKEKPITENEPLAFIIHAITNTKITAESEVNDFVEIFKKNDIKQIVMANMATHPQYSGKKLSALKEDPFSREILGEDLTHRSAFLINNFLFMKDVSRQIGCLEADPRALFIRHIFCDYISNQLQHAQTGLFYNGPVYDINASYWGGQKIN